MIAFTRRVVVMSEKRLWQGMVPLVAAFSTTAI